MGKKQLITDNKVLANYKFNCLFSKKINDNKLISEEDFKTRKKGKYFKVNNKYYLKLPKFTIKAKKIIAVSLASLLVAGAAATVTVFYMPHRVTLNSSYLEINKSNKACLGYDYKCNLKIKDDKLADNYMKNIKISSIKSNGKEIPVDGYSFVYQTNAKNELTINKKYLGGQIEINADLGTRQSKHNCFWFEFAITKYSDFDTLNINIPQGENKIVRVKENESYKDKLKAALDLENAKFDIVDNVLMKPECDALMVKKGAYTVDLSGGKKFSYAFPSDMVFVREDNSIKFNITAKDNLTLPKNLWLRSNARYTKKDEDFFLAFSNEYKNATIEIPYYFIRDNGSININPEVEG